MISRLARLISNLDLIDRDVIHECSCSDSWLEPKNLIFLFGPVPKPEFGLSLIIRITWISGSRGSLGSYYMYLQLDHVIRECIIRKTVRSLFWNCSRTAWIVKIVKLPGVWKSFFLESNIFLIKCEFFFSCNSHGWTVFDFFFRLKENLRGRCGWCWTEEKKTKTDQN